MTSSNNDREKTQAAMNQTLFMLILEHWKCGKGVQLFNATDEQSNTSGIVIAEVELGNDFASGKN